jgi:hypothetical protein
MVNQKEHKKFNWKSFISFGLFISFFIIVATGLVLYIAPPGRVAKWVNWQFSGLSKEMWQALHTNFTYTFLILSIFHIFSMNWKVFLSYLKKKAAGTGLNRKKELVIGLILIAVVFCGTLFNIPPFKTVMDIGEYFTESWEKKEERAPMPHTEALTIKKLAAKLIKLTPEEIIEKLKRNNIRVTGAEQTLKEIGEANKVSPFDVYQIIARDGEEKKTTVDSLLKQGSGLGRKTLSEVAGVLDRDVKVLIEQLKKSGIEAHEDEKFKDIAEKAGITPYELVERLKNAPLE